jgi:hypothetical protein
MLTADQMRALPDFFTDIPDPRRTQGRRHPLPAVLAVATAAVRCGMRGYQAIGLIRSKNRDTVAATLQRLARTPRMVLDYLRLSANALPRSTAAAA